MEESVLAPEALAPETATVVRREAPRPGGSDVEGRPAGGPRRASLHGLRAQAVNLGQLLGSHFVVAGAGLASLPILARNLGTEAYGRFSLFVLVLGVLSNLDVARPILVREFSRARDGDVQTRSTAASLAATSGWLLATAALALGWMVGGPVVACALALGVYLHALTSAPFARLSAEGRVGIAGSIRNAYWAAALAAVVAASFLTRSPHAWIWAFAGANGLILATYLRVSPAHTRTFRLPSLEALRRFRLQASDVFYFALASAVVTSCDRLLLEANASETVFGHYTAQYDLAIKINIVSTALCSVVYPSFSRLHADEGTLAASKRFVQMASRIAVLYFFGLATLVLAHERVLELVFGRDFATSASLDVYALMLVGVFLHLFGFLITPYQRACGDFRTHRIVYLWTAALMLGVGVYAIPRFGAAGAVATYLCARLAEVILVAIEVRRIPREVLPLWKVGAFVAMVLALAALGWLAFAGRLDGAIEVFSTRRPIR